MRFSVLAEFFFGFAVLDGFFFGFAVSNTPQCPPPETTQTFTKMLSLGLNIIFRLNDSIGKGLGCFSYGELMTCKP